MFSAVQTPAGANKKWHSVLWCHLRHNGMGEWFLCKQAIFK